MSGKIKSNPEIVPFCRPLRQLKVGELFANKFKVWERIGWNDRVGTSYLVTNVQEQELMLRVDDNENDTSTVKVEAVFLNKAEKANLSAQFMQVHASGLVQDLVYLALFYRGGPSLRECIRFMPQHRFSPGTVGRLAIDILKVIEATHRLGYLLRSMDTDMFHLDVASRHLFLSDLSTIRLNPRSVNLAMTTRWVGGPQYAPFSFHNNESLSARDELEAWFYLFVEMSIGALPWNAVHADLIPELKRTTIEDGSLIGALPAQYHKLQQAIWAMKGDEVPDYAILHQLSEEIFVEVGGIKDHECNFDFERNPDESELPRFILEKISKDGSSTNGTQEKTVNKR